MGHASSPAGEVTKVPAVPCLHLYAECMVRDDWTFLSNHGHALVCLAGDPDIRLREVASQIGVTERCAQQIVSDLEAGGIIERTRTGRRNTYTVRRNAHFRHALESDLTVGEFVDLVGCARSSFDEAPRVDSARPAASPWDDAGTTTAPDRTPWQPASTPSRITIGPRERSRSARERLADGRRPRVAHLVDERGAYVVGRRPGRAGRQGQPLSPPHDRLPGHTKAQSSRGA